MKSAVLVSAILGLCIFTSVALALPAPDAEDKINSEITEEETVTVSETDNNDDSAVFPEELGEQPSDDNPEEERDNNEMEEIEEDETTTPETAGANEADLSETSKPKPELEQESATADETSAGASQPTEDESSA